MTSPKSLADLEWSWVHSRRFRTSDPWRNVMGQSIEMSSLISMLFGHSQILEILMVIFNILVRILLPTKFLRASSTWHRTTMDPTHTRGRMEISEPLRRWQSDIYCIRGMGNLYPQCINIPQCCHCVTGFYIYTSSLTKPAAFSKAMELFSTSYIRTQHLIYS